MILEENQWNETVCEKQVRRSAGESMKPRLSLLAVIDVQRPDGARELTRIYGYRRLILKE